MGFSISKKVLLLAVFTFLVVSASSEPPQRSTRLPLQDADVEGKEELVLPIASGSTSSNNNTKLLNSSKQSSKTSSITTKNMTNLIKPVSGSVKNTEADGLRKTNSNFKPSSHSSKSRSSSKSPKNKTSKSPTAYENAELTTEKIMKEEAGIEVDTKPASATKVQKKNATDNKDQHQNPKQQLTKNPSQPSWIYNSDDDDLVSEFADLPAKFQRTIIPDIKRISSSSKVYFSKANKEIARGFKPYVGNKFAPTAATAISFAFIIIPFLLVSVLFNRIKAYSLQRLLILVQVYLSIYFSILCLSSLITGLEPLRFFYATSQSTYVWLQVQKTLGYVFYLLSLLMYLVLVFSTGTGLRLKLLGLAQTFLGFSVGLHYYMTVFHRMVLRQPPKTSCKVHAIYATCFLLICLLAGSDGGKKAYVGDAGEDGKKS